MSRRRIVIGGVAALIFVVGWVFSRDTIQKSVWAEAKRGDLVLTVEVNGVLQAVHTPVGPPEVPDVYDFKIAMMAPEGTDVAPVPRCSPSTRASWSASSSKKPRASPPASASRRRRKDSRDGARERRAAARRGHLAYAGRPRSSSRSLKSSSRASSCGSPASTSRTPSARSSSSKPSSRRTPCGGGGARGAARAEGRRRSRVRRSSLDRRDVRQSRESGHGRLRDQLARREEEGRRLAWRGERVLEIPTSAP
jgi:hypothetical protein